MGHSGPRPSCYGTREARGGKLHLIFQVLYLFKHFSTQFYRHTCSSAICNAPKSYQVIERRQKLPKEIFFNVINPGQFPSSIPYTILHVVAPAHKLGVWSRNRRWVLFKLSLLPKQTPQLQLRGTTPALHRAGVSRNSQRQSNLLFPGLAPRPKFLLVFAQVLSCQAQTLRRSHCCRGYRANDNTTSF